MKRKIADFSTWQAMCECEACVSKKILLTKNLHKLLFFSYLNLP